MSQILIVLLVFQSHPELCKRKYRDFGRWHNEWTAENVTESAQESHATWMMGRCEGLVPNKTHRLTISDPAKTPYRTFTRFMADVGGGPNKASSS